MSKTLKDQVIYPDPRCGKDIITVGDIRVGIGLTEPVIPTAAVLARRDYLVKEQGYFEVGAVYMVMQELKALTDTPSGGDN